MEWISRASTDSPEVQPEIETASMPEKEKGNSLLPRVLVIDDEQLLGQTIQLGLEDSMDVVLESSGLRGLARLLRGEEFALVLCDLSMPEISGGQIYARLSQERPELLKNFVVMTGGAVSAESRDFMNVYRGALLSKPFSLSQVEELVRSLLAAE